MKLELMILRIKTGLGHINTHTATTARVLENPLSKWSDLWSSSAHPTKRLRVILLRGFFRSVSLLRAPYWSTKELIGCGYGMCNVMFVARWGLRQGGGGLFTLSSKSKKGVIEPTILWIANDLRTSWLSPFLPEWKDQATSSKILFDPYFLCQAKKKKMQNKLN